MAPRSSRQRPTPTLADGERSVDVAIIGFGFSGLVTLAHLAARMLPLSVAIIADDPRGLGLAYSTREPQHLLNVPANRMGAWASRPGDFGRWLASPEGARACARLGVSVPGPDDFAPRAIFGEYLADLRRRVVAKAGAAGMVLKRTTARAERIEPLDGGWRITAGASRFHARAVVLATGNEPTMRAEGVTHLGSADVARRPPRDTGAPAVLLGTGLTAVDALLSLRASGFTGPVIAASRTGLLPRPHRLGAQASPLGDDAAALTSVSSVARFLRESAAGGDWRLALDGLRPHTSAIWQRLPPEQQQSVVHRWSTWWSVHRHRMAPENAALLDAEIQAGSLRVLAASARGSAPSRDGLSLTLTHRDGATELLQAAALIDCTGVRPNLSDEGQPLLRGLLDDRIVTLHHTGLGFVADEQLQVAENLYAIGNLLIGQLWESIAVPELREQAAVIARAAVRTRTRPQTGRDGRPAQRLINDHHWSGSASAVSTSM